MLHMIKIDLNDLDRYFQKAELIPAICYEVDTKTVLMLAYMNKESLRRTLETGYTWFWSRSRQEYWNKGATSCLNLCRLRRRYAADQRQTNRRRLPYGRI